MSISMKKYKLGILGVGNMGGSILNGIVNSSLYKKEEIYLYDTNVIKQDKLKQQGFILALNEQDLIENVEMAILAVKPQMFDALKQYNYKINNLVIISIAAGITINTLKNIFGEQLFIRVMPNTPSLINKGATAISKDEKVPQDIFEKVKEIFSAIGVTCAVPDSLMNEIIPINGSMPAFIYYFIQSFIECGTSYGLDYDVCKVLAAHSIIGSCEMILKAEKSIEELIKDVCSPKGVTLEGLKVLDDNHFKDIIKEVSASCIKRACELSK